MLQADAIQNHAFSQSSNSNSFLAYSAARYVDIFFDYALFAYLVIVIYHGGPLAASILPVLFTLPNVLFSGTLSRLATSKANSLSFVCFNALASVCVISLITTDSLLFTYLLIFIKCIGRCYVSLCLQNHIASRFSDANQLSINTTFNKIQNIAKIASPIAFSSFVAMDCGQYALSASAGWSLIICILALLFCKKLSSGQPMRRAETKSDYQTNRKKSFFFFAQLTKNLEQGYRCFASNNLLRTALVAFTVAAAAVAFSDDLLAYMLVHGGSDDSIIGYLIAVIGAGGVTGTMVLAKIRESMPVRTIFSLSLLSDAVCFIVFATANAFSQVVMTWLVFCTAFIMGIGTSFGVVGFRTLLYTHIDHSDRAPVIALVQTISSLCMLIFPIVGGLTANFTNIVVPFASTGITLLTATIYFDRKNHA